MAVAALPIPFTTRGLARAAARRLAPSRRAVTPFAGPLARVRNAVMASASGSGPITVQFTPIAPAVGNAVVVQIATYGNYAPQATGTDNYGNVYQLARYFDGSASSGNIASSAIYYCPKITATGTAPTFTISIPIPSVNLWTAGATEVTNIGTGLVVDVSSGQYGSSGLTATSGQTAAITAAEAFAVAVVSLNQNQGSLAINATGPTWTQEWENLFAGNEAGEADSAPLSAATGTKVTASWTLQNGALWCGLVVVFKAGAPAGGGSARLYPPDRSAGVVVSVPSFDFLIASSGIVYSHIATDSGGVWEYAQVNPRRGL